MTKNKTAEQQLIEKILTDDFTRGMLKELGVHNSSHEAQEEILAKLSANIVERVMLEILTALPESARPEFESYVGGGDVHGFRTFLEKHFDDFDAFAQGEINKEYERTKTKIHMIAQGV